MTIPPATTHSSRSRRSATASRRRGPASARYYVCVAILVVSAVTLPLLAELMGAHFRKKPVPLKRSLACLDWVQLEPNYQQHPTVQPGPLNEETVQGLGTEEYLQARLVDTARRPADSARVAMVFITYYTGKPDMVPHVPDECYLAGGYDRVGRPETVRVRVPGVGAPDDRIPVRVLQFQSRVGRKNPTVLYFFHTNGQYKTTRDEVRWVLANPFARYAYYAKVEITFTNDSGGELAGREKSIEALGPLLQELMPVLFADHFAWDEVTSGQDEAGRG